MGFRYPSVRLFAVVLAAGLLGGCGGSVSTPSETAAASRVPIASAIDRPTPAASPGSDAVATGGTVDTGDEPGGSETPAIGFTPGPTGAPVPVISAAPMARLPGEPDPVLTPGALNLDVTQASIGSTICTSGWTATIRPPTSYTNALKKTQIAQYGYADTSLASYEEDHLISLELGGNPTDPRNLWPEPYTISLPDGRSVGAHVKDGFETKLKNEVCKGAIKLATAQAEIGDHWVHFALGITIP